MSRSVKEISKELEAKIMEQAVTANDVIQPNSAGQVKFKRIEEPMNFAEKMEYCMINIATLNHTEYEDRFKKIPNSIKEQLNWMYGALESEHNRAERSGRESNGQRTPTDESEDVRAAEIEELKKQMEEMSGNCRTEQLKIISLGTELSERDEEIKELKTKISELTSELEHATHLVEEFGRSIREKDIEIANLIGPKAVRNQRISRESSPTSNSNVINSSQRSLPKSRNQTSSSSSNSSRRSIAPDASTHSKSVWFEKAILSKTSANRKEESSDITVYVIRPRTPADFNRILNETRDRMLRFKSTVTFEGLGPSGPRREKIVVKFQNTQTENELAAELRQLKAEVWKFESVKRIMVMQIDKWLPDDDILQDVIISNSIDPSKIKLERIINNPEYNTKRAILKIEDQLLTTLLERPGKNGNKLNVGFRAVPFRMLTDRDRNSPTCHHCKQPGHRGYRASRGPPLENGGVGELEWTLVCPNVCDKCTNDESNRRTCTADSAPSARKANKMVEQVQQTNPAEDTNQSNSSIENQQNAN